MDNSPRSKLAISRVTFEDIPTLAEADILAFLNDKIVSTVFNRNRWTPRDSGAPVHTWLDYGETIERIKRALVSNATLYKIARRDDNKPLGMVSISFPGDRRDRTWSDWMWGDYLYPMLKYMGICEKGRSTFASAMAHRESLLQGKVYASINKLYIHPDAQGTGAGTLLLDHCITLANTEGLPLVLESSEAAFEFYKKLGFIKIAEGKIEYKGSTVSWPVMIREPLLSIKPRE